MRVLIVSVTLALVATGMASAIPTKDEDSNDHKTRVLQKELSDEKHFLDGDMEEHNADFDHEAFLGHDEARTFDQLSPEESKEKLAILYDKIDKDGDGQVGQTELEEWIHYVQRKYLMEDTKRQWEEHESVDDKLTWDSYKKRTYGFVDGDGDDVDYMDMIKRDVRRWEKADEDGDKQLNQEEFSNFLHPEDAKHMRDIVVDETMEDIDKDGDGLISLEEYIGDMWPNHDQEDEPDWVGTEREQFSDFRDKNKDKVMDREEVREWIIPDDYDHVKAEMEHLFYESDLDRDKMLTKEEVLNKWDLFVGSQATEFGEALVRHDEF